MARRGGNPRVSIQADQNVDKAVRDAQGSLNRLERSADKTGSKLHGFASVTGKGFSRVGVAATGMAATGAAAAALLTKSFVSGASDIQESLSKNRVLFGKFADDVAKFSESSAKQFGISKQAALEYTGTFGNLFRATGVARKESAQFSVQLTKLAADMASFNNTSIEDALEAIRSGIVGETEPLRRFGVNLNDAQLRNEALRLGLVKTTKEALDPQSKALAAQALIVKQTAAAHGDFARTSGGLANQQRILKAQLADAGAELGGKLIPFALKAVKAVNSLFDSSSKGGRAIQQMGRWAAEAAGWIKGAWSDAVGAVSRFVDRNREDIQGVIRALRSLGRFFQDVFNDVVVPTVRRAIPVIKGIFDGLVQIFRGLVRIVSGIVTGDWKRVWQGVKDVIAGEFKAAKTYILGVPRVLGPAMFDLAKKLIAALVRGLAGLPGAIKNAIVSGVKKGVEAAGGVVGDIISAVNPFGDGIGRLAKGIGDGVGASVGSGSGASLMGADPDLYPFAALAANMGLRTSSGLRSGLTSSGNPSYHNTGDAIDEYGPMGAMRQYATTMFRRFGGRLRELISPWPELGIKDGHPFRYSSQIQAEHSGSNAHVHVAYTGPFGDGIGQAARAARAAGFRGRDLLTAIAIAGPESGFHNRRRLLTSAEDSRGMTQINTYAHPWARNVNLYDEFANYRAAYRVWREAGGSFRPWTGFTSGGYRAYLDDARRAVRALRKDQGNKGKAKGKGGKFGVGLGDEPIPVPNALDLGFGQADGFGGGGATGGDSGGSATPTVDTGAAELAAQLKRMNDFNDWLVNTQGPTLIGAVVAAVNGGIGGQVGLGFSGIRSPAGSVAGL